MDLLFAHRFSYGFVFFAFTLGFAFGIGGTLFTAWWMWCRKGAR